VICIRLSEMLNLMKSPLHLNRYDYMTEKRYSNSFWIKRFYNYIILYQLDELYFLARLVSRIIEVYKPSNTSNFRETRHH